MGRHPAASLLLALLASLSALQARGAVGESAPAGPDAQRALPYSRAAPLEASTTLRAVAAVQLQSTIPSSVSRPPTPLPAGTATATTVVNVAAIEDARLQTLQVMELAVEELCVGNTTAVEAATGVAGVVAEVRRLHCMTLPGQEQSQSVPRCSGRALGGFRGLLARGSPNSACPSVQAALSTVSVFAGTSTTAGAAACAGGSAVGACASRRWCWALAVCSSAEYGDVATRLCVARRNSRLHRASRTCVVSHLQ